MNPMWLVLVLPALGLGALGVLLWLGAKERRRTEADLASIRDLSCQAAERLAMALLNRPGLFGVVPAPVPFSHPGVPPHVVSLFNHFAEVARGEFRIAQDLLPRSPRLSGFIKIGEDSEFTEILVKPGASEVFVQPGEGPDQPLEPEPTVWHLIITASGLSPSDLGLDAGHPATSRSGAF